MIVTPDLESMTAALDGATVKLLGDSFLYTPVGGVAVTLKAFVAYNDERHGLGGAVVIVGAEGMEVRKVDMPNPQKGDTFTLPRNGKTYTSKERTTDESGNFWRILFKELPA